MNKLLLLTVLVGVCSAQRVCTPPRGGFTECEHCEFDIGDPRCEELYNKGTASAECKTWIECNMMKSREPDAEACPLEVDKENVCLADHEGDIPWDGSQKYQCERWAKAGYCFDKIGEKYFTNFMIPFCMEACCHVCSIRSDGCPKYKHQCRNLHNEPLQCEGWAIAGECTKNPVWMLRNCQNACCPLCKPKPPARKPATAPAGAPAGAPVRPARITYQTQPQVTYQPRQTFYQPQTFFRSNTGLYGR